MLYKAAERAYLYKNSSGRVSSFPVSLLLFWKIYLNFDLRTSSKIFYVTYIFLLVAVAAYAAPCYPCPYPPLLLPLTFHFVKWTTKFVLQLVGGVVFCFYFAFSIFVFLLLLS